MSSTGLQLNAFTRKGTYSQSSSTSCQRMQFDFALMVHFGRGMLAGLETSLATVRGDLEQRINTQVVSSVGCYHN